MTDIDQAILTQIEMNGDGYALFTLVLQTFWHEPRYKPLVNGLKIEMKRPFLAIARQLWDIMDFVQQSRWHTIASSEPETRPTWTSLEYDVAQLAADFIMYVNGKQRVI